MVSLYRLKMIYQKLTRGYSDNELWSLDVTTAKFLLPRLRRFKEMNMGYPSHLTEKGWLDVQDAVIEAMETIVNEDIFSPGREERSAKSRHGLELFIQYFNHYWQ